MHGFYILAHEVILQTVNIYFINRNVVSISCIYLNTRNAISLLLYGLCVYDIT